MFCTYTRTWCEFFRLKYAKKYFKICVFQTSSFSENDPPNLTVLHTQTGYKRKPSHRNHRIFYRNCDNKNGDTSKRRHSKTATTVVKTATTRVKTATTISQNGDKHWSKRRQSFVKTATVIGQNGDSSQSTAKKFGRSKRRQ